MRDKSIPNFTMWLFFIMLMTCGNIYASTNVSGTISQDSTWTLSNSPYIVTGDITVAESVKLTIEPGVTIKFNSNCDLYVNGGLYANGTLSNPITFTSNENPTSGSWGGIQFSSTCTDSWCVLNWVNIMYGGQESYAIDHPIVLNAMANPTITNVTLTNNRTNGVVLITGTYSSNITLDITSLPYMIFGDLGIASGYTMTIVPGVVLKFGDRCDLYINGGLTANGTPGNHIIFTSRKDDEHGGDSNADGPSIGLSGDWGGIQFNESTIDANTVLNYCDVMYGGQTSGAIYHPIVLDARANPTITNVTLINNRRNGINLVAGTYSSSITLNITGLPYMIFGDVAIASGYTMTINPGVVLKFGEDTYDLYVYGVLTANGTSENYIIFTSILDDRYGGDTDGDGSSAGSPGNWGQIKFTELSSNSMLSYAKIMFAGRSGYSALFFDKASPKIENIIISDVGGNGVQCYNSASPDLGGGSKGSVGCNSFLGFTDNANKYAVYNDGTSNINAKHNYWGTDSSSQIAKDVYDYSDNANKGQVYYSPYNKTDDFISPTVTLLSLNGSEQLEIGFPYDITWAASDNVGVANIAIYYSSNEGSFYYSIDTSETNDGIFTWVVPNTPSANCRVKIVASDAEGNTAEDVSETNFIILPTNAPALSWTEETNYISDGLAPETGGYSASFVYRVKYTDVDNDPPLPDYPRVHILKGGGEISGSPFTMSEVDSGDTNYVDGKVYTHTKTELSFGADYTYYFEAKDIHSVDATGAPTNPTDAPDVANSAPALSWTGETNYTSDGLNPETANVITDFIYRVKYTDINNDQPKSGYPKAHIKKDGVAIAGSPFTMTYVSGDFNTGAIYSYSTRLAPGVDYTYYFEAYDAWNAPATGTPATAIDAPDVTCQIKGYVRDPSGVGVEGVTLTLSGYSSAVSTTTSTGYYEFLGIIPGSDYTITPTYENFLFIPSEKTYSNLNSNQEDQNFTANNFPTLSWTGETNYTSDGLNPETANVITDFIYRVKYTDINNDQPKSGYPKIHIKKDGVEIAESPFIMTYVTGDVTTGAIYSYSATLAPGTAYTYYFEAYDVRNAPATGTPATAIDAPDVINNNPTLSWTGETNYISDALHPESGSPYTIFAYRVKYVDPDNELPKEGYPKLHIKKDGVEIANSPFAMTYANGDFHAGDIYFYSTTLLPGANYTYYFEAYDIWDAPATGTATEPIAAPEVINNNPTLSWTEEENYAADGLNPESGGTSETFAYRIKYTDINNDQPKAGYPKIHIKKGEVEIAGSPFKMTYMSGDFNTGAIYSYSTTLAPGKDYTYYFEVYDVWDALATDTPATAIDAPDVTNNNPTISWTGETNYTSDALHPESGSPFTIFTYRVKYVDPDNDPPKEGYPKLYIKKDGIEIEGSPFTMTYVSGDFNTGAIYLYSTTLTSGVDYTYYLEAYDVWDAPATGEAIIEKDGPELNILAGWSIQTVDSVGAVGWDPSLALDTNGYPHISYHAATNGDLRYARWTGSGWDIQTVDSAGSVGWYPSLALDTNGYPHIGYCDGTNNDLKYAKWTGSGWDIQTVDSEGYAGNYTSLALDTDGHPCISYYDRSNENLKYARWTGSGWDIQTVDSEGDVGRYLSFALDTNSYPHISYYNGDLKYAKWTGSGWDIQTVDSEGNVGRGTSLALDTNGYPHISYYDWDNGDLKYVRWTGAGWDIQTVDSAGDVGRGTSLALDTNGYPHISCYDYTNYDLKYARWANNPTLSWTGEPNYTSDGLHPESGSWSTSFAYRVKYTNTNNDPPKEGYPQVHIKKGGVEITGSPFTIAYVSGDFNTGAIYSYPTTLALSADYTYYFEAYDVWNAPATGTPTDTIDAPDVINNSPSLSWSGEPNYTLDGLSPEIGSPLTPFAYRVKYTDVDNNPPLPDYPKVHILKDGVKINGSPFAMEEVNSKDTNYVDGKLYTYNKIGLSSGTNYTYYFEAKDICSASATGDPTSFQHGPGVFTFASSPSAFDGEVISPSQIKWCWTDNADNEDGYRVYNLEGECVSGDLPADTTCWEETGLSPNTQYTRYASAYNVLGNSDSDFVSIYTLANVPANLVVVGNTPTSITLAWNGDGTRYAIEKAQDINGSPESWGHLTQWADNIDSSIYTDEGASPDTIYWYRVRAYNGDQMITEPGNEISIQTLPNAPTEFSGEAISSSQIKWSWIDNSSVEIGYRIHSDTQEIIAALSSDTTSWTEAGLNPNTQYTRYISAYNNFGDSNFNSVSVYTLANIPSSLHLVSQTPSSVTIGWTGDGTRYAIERALDSNGSPGIWSSIRQWDDIITRITYTDTIDKDKVYWYRVRAYNGDQVITEPGSEVHTDISPPIGKPATPTDDNGDIEPGTVSCLTSTAITFYWEKGEVDDPESGIAGYYLQVGTNPGGSDVFDGYMGNALSKEIANCEVGKIYYARVKAKNNIGSYSDWSGSSGGTQVIPQIYSFPNPFSPGEGTNFKYGLDKGANSVAVKIYNLSGSLIKSMDDLPTTIGIHTKHWDGEDDDGGKIRPGLYIYVIEIDDKVTTKQFLQASE
ncbi:MAG: FlgD immunoglobulin-like domain containing protein [bacterium]|nr:FlgD immunoglobulin-like domain containing protein [bacterium]